MLYHIVAMAKNRVIGKDNQLPWHFPSDLKHFKQLTMGSTIIMGRKTFESIGRALPGRHMIVLTRLGKTSVPEALLVNQDISFCSSLAKALESVTTKDAFIIGGADLYQQTIDKVDGIYLTRIDADYEGDAFYPEIPEGFDEVEIEKLQDNPKIEVVFYEK